MRFVFAQNAQLILGRAGLERKGVVGVDFFPPAASVMNFLGLATPNEGSVLVVEFARDAFGAGLGDELNFADKISAPGLIHARAKFLLHGFELLLPGFAVGGDLQASRLAAHRLGVRGKNFSHDVGPRAGEPGQRRFGALEPPQHTAKKFSRSLHGRGF
jgi:hypothetical protein